MDFPVVPGRSPLQCPAKPPSARSFKSARTNPARMIDPMLLGLVLLLSLASPPQDPVATALEKYDHTTSYRVTLRSGQGDSSEIIKYFYKKPGFIRMEFIRPHEGAVLIYDPIEKKVRLRPFESTGAVVLTLNPDDNLVKSAQGHRVDDSDIGALLRRVDRLKKHGQTTILGEEKVGERQTLVVRVEGEKDFAPEGRHRYILNLDETVWLPLKVRAYDTSGNLLEEVLMDDLETNVQLDDALFKP